MEIKHTKSPWIQSEFNPQNIVTSEDPMKSTTICIISGNVKREEEIMANAKLIAAAPELLKAISDIIESIDNDYGAFKAVDKDSLYIKYAREAIKKATE